MGTNTGHVASFPEIRGERPRARPTEECIASLGYELGVARVHI